MSKNDVIRMIADMVMDRYNDVNVKGVGVYINSYWLSPSQCHEIANLIEEVNDEDYGAGNWKVDKNAIMILRNHSYQNY